MGALLMVKAVYVKPIKLEVSRFGPLYLFIGAMVQGTG